MKKLSSLTKYVIFSFSMVILMTIACLILQTFRPETDYSTYYTVFCGIFGGETLGCVILKIFKIKNPNN